MPLHPPDGYKKSLICSHFAAANPKESPEHAENAAHSGLGKMIVIIRTRLCC
jgi:hypothetical protein